MALPVRLALLAPIVVYLVLVLSGATTSSIGAASLREDPADPQGLQIGQSQLVRGDEYGTESPIWLGEMASHAQDSVTPLTVSNDFFAQLPDGPVSAIVFFDGTALSLSPLLPDSMLFAAKWWLPTLLLFLGLPFWFRYITGSFRWGYLASVLIMFSPSAMWWSGRPVNTLGFVAAGCALAIFGALRLFRRAWSERLLAVAAILLSGILLARTPTYYQPLAIVVGVPVVAATAAHLLARSAPWRERLIGIGAITLSGAVWTALLMWENREAIAVGLATVYPGGRQSTGSALSAGEVFGATSLGWLEDLGLAVTTNQTEIASSFTLLLVVLVVLFAAQRWTGGRAHAWATATTVAFGTFWLSWATVSWGPVGAMLPLVNRVPDARAAEAVGFIAILAFCLFMAQWQGSDRIAVPLLAAALAGWLSAYGGSSLQRELMPDLTPWMIGASALVTAAVVFVLVRWPRRLWPLVTAGAASIVLTGTAVPILFGLGDLRQSDTAQDFMVWGEQARSDGTVWASDDMMLDSLMAATGTPSLSARQQIGPDAAQWERLDPGGAHQDLWNRGGLHIVFSWTDDDGLGFSQPVADTVVITGSPCAVADRIPELTRVASGVELDETCLSAIDEFEWGGREFTVYAIAGAG